MSETIEIVLEDNVLSDTELKLIDCVGNIFKSAKNDPETLLEPVVNFTNSFVKKLSPESHSTSGLASALIQFSGSQKPIDRKSIKVNNPARRSYNRKGSNSVGVGQVPKNSNFEVRPVVHPQDNAYQVPSKRRKTPHQFASKVAKKKAEVAETNST